MGKYGLLGQKLSHSFSPLIHSQLADYEYSLYEKEPDALEGFLTKGDFDGLNVTIPYKKAVMPFCSYLSESARRIGCVNTIVRKNDRTLAGYNTDYYGFAFMLGQMGLNPAGQKALILGSGGSSLTVRAVLEDRGAREIVVVSRSGQNNYSNLFLHSDASIIINTTPLGMYPQNGKAPVGLEAFPACRAVLDLIYNPSETALLLDAAGRSIPRVNGLPMLVAQAKKAAEIFLSSPISDDLIAPIVQKIARDTKNVALIGMPGCGKSCTGRELAGITGRKFYDLDRMIENSAGKSIPDIFEQEGEEFFRRLETDILKEVSAESGSVIATGGGVVVRPENLPALRQNSTIVFLERDISELSCNNRPLSLKTGVKALAEKRLPLYRAWSDYTVRARGARPTAEAIKELLEI